MKITLPRLDEAVGCLAGFEKAEGKVLLPGFTKEALDVRIEKFR